MPEIQLTLRDLRGPMAPPGIGENSHRAGSKYDGQPPF